MTSSFKALLRLTPLLLLAACGGVDLGEAESDNDVLLEGESALLSTTSLKWAMDPATGQVSIPWEMANVGAVSAAAYTRAHDDILRAMAHWQANVRKPDGSALLDFRPRNGETRYVRFEVKPNGNACYVSPNGTGKTRVDSDPSCGWQTYVHEVGHVLTFRHEQKRSDRDTYILLHLDRTSEDPEFAIVGGNKLGTDYDSRSIMHYGSCTFSDVSPCNGTTPNAWVVERKTGTPYIKGITQRIAAEVLSPSDICGLQRLYDLACEFADGGVASATNDAGAATAINDAGASTAMTDGGTGTAMTDGGTGTTMSDGGTGTAMNDAGGATSADAGAEETLPCSECASDELSDSGVNLGDGDAECVALTCEEAGASCGEVGDGCGGTLSCGVCETALPSNDVVQQSFGCTSVGSDGVLWLCGVVLAALNRKRVRIRSSRR